MLAASLSTDVWLGVGLIAAITVVTCLAVIANILRYELEFIRVVANVKKLRDRLARQIEEAEVEIVEEATPVAGYPEMIDSLSPMPDSAESAETDAIIDSPPEPEAETESITDLPVDAEPDSEPAATESAQAA
jgi:hypothetical protein